MDRLEKQENLFGTPALARAGWRRSRARRSRYVAPPLDLLSRLSGRPNNQVGWFHDVTRRRVACCAPMIAFS